MSIAFASKRTTACWKTGIEAFTIIYKPEAIRQLWPDAVHSADSPHKSGWERQTGRSQSMNHTATGVGFGDRVLNGVGERLQGRWVTNPFAAGNCPSNLIDFDALGKWALVRSVRKHAPLVRCNRWRRKIQVRLQHLIDGTMFSKTKSCVFHWARGALKCVFSYWISNYIKQPD